MDLKQYMGHRKRSPVIIIVIAFIVLIFLIIARQNVSKFIKQPGENLVIRIMYTPDSAVKKSKPVLLMLDKRVLFIRDSMVKKTDTLITVKLSLGPHEFKLMNNLSLSGPIKKFNYTGEPLIQINLKADSLSISN